LLFAEAPKSKIHSPVVGGFIQIDTLFCNCSACAFASTASGAEWFFIAALSVAIKKDTLLRVLCVSAVRKALNFNKNV
jgi:hypothetical protein